MQSKIKVKKKKFINYNYCNKENCLRDIKKKFN